MGLPWDALDTHGATFFQPLKDVEPGIPQPARRAGQDSNWHGPFEGQPIVFIRLAFEMSATCPVSGRSYRPVSGV